MPIKEAPDRKDTSRQIRCGERQDFLPRPKVSHYLLPMACIEIIIYLEGYLSCPSYTLYLLILHII